MDDEVHGLLLETYFVWETVHCYSHTNQKFKFSLELTSISYLFFHVTILLG